MTVPNPFRQACCVEIDGQILTVSCDVKNHRTGDIHHIRKSFDLEPLTAYIYDQLVAVHQQMHGEVDVSGLGSFLSRATDAAKRIASSKGIQSVYNKVKSVAGPAIKSAIKDIPGGEATMALATKTYDQVMKARSGDKGALADLKKVASKALAGNQLASQIMDTAKKLSAVQNTKEGKDPTDLAWRTTRIEALLHPLLPANRGAKGGVSVSGAYAYDIIGARGAKRPATRGGAIARAQLAARKKAAKKMARAAAPPPRVITPAVRRMVAPKPDDAYKAPKIVEEEIIEEMEEEGYDEEQIEEEISGWREWLYTRPYRSPAAAALQGDIGAGMRLRYLYTNGMDAILNRAR